MTTTFDVTTVGLALLAFVVALYVLAARDQKTPYFTNSIYSMALVILTAVFLSSIAKLAKGHFGAWPDRLEFVAIALVFVAIFQVAHSVWSARSRRLFLRDDQLGRMIKSAIELRWLQQVLSRGTSYEYNVERFPQHLVDCIDASEALDGGFKSALAQAQSFERLTEASLSVGCHASTLDDADRFLTKLAICFLQHGCYVQYASCTRHPVEFILKLKSAMQDVPDCTFGKVAGHLVAVDGYTRHFGFGDSIHSKATDAAVKLGVKWVTAKSSYASLHTASARAFNIIKRDRKRSSDVRAPALVIYDGPYALVDLESREQYRIFLRHVLPSERLWGGMLTVIVEFGMDSDDLALLRGYSDVFVNISGKTPNNV